ncbi:MAG: thiaminase II [Pseudomonadota bacterium]
MRSTATEIVPADSSEVFERLKTGATAAWRGYVAHAFVSGLGDGSLPRESFLHYLKQDYLFLVHFSRAWGFAVAKSDRLSEMRAAATVVDALLNHEMLLHVETCAAEGIDEASLAATVEASENLAYTRFVIDAGLRGDFLDLIVALAPCVLGYGEIGARLKAEAGATLARNPYRDWIETYAGQEYQQVCAMKRGLLEEATAARLGAEPERSPRWADLQKTFETATRLEIGFWDMGLRGV